VGPALATLVAAARPTAAVRLLLTLGGLARLAGLTAATSFKSTKHLGKVVLVANKTRVYIHGRENVKIKINYLRAYARAVAPPRCGVRSGYGEAHIDHQLSENN
jgi:hypothetical protein